MSPAVREIDASIEKSKSLPFMRLLESQDDRGAAIYGAAVIEERLAEEIQRSWAPMQKPIADRLFNGSGPLAPFAARIDVAYAMHLISNSTRQDAHTIRRIAERARQVALPFSFGADDVRRLSDELIIPKHVAGDDRPNVARERNLFTTAVRVAAMSIQLHRVLRGKFGEEVKPFDAVTAAARPA
jgi:hypothetical protein